MATDYSNLVAQLEALADSATTAKAQSADSVEVKASRAASTLSALIGTEGFPTIGEAEEVEAFADTLKRVMALGPSAFDRSDGDALAKRVATMLALDPEDAPDAFKPVADAAKLAVDAWNESAPRRGGRPAGSSGESTTPASQKLSTNNLKSVRVTMTRPDGVVKTIEHGSTWSSLSDQINRVFKDVIGKSDVNDGSVSYGKSDPSARDAWRKATKALKSGDMGPHAFDIDTGATGKINVSLEGVSA